MNQVYLVFQCCSQHLFFTFLGVQKQYHRVTIRSLNAIEHVLT